MKALVLSLAVLASTVSLSAFAIENITEQEDRALALVKSVYLFDQSEISATYTVIDNLHDRRIIISRTGPGGACTRVVNFNSDGTISIGAAKCPKGS